MSALTACLYGFTDKLDFIPSYNSQQCFLEKPDFVPTFNSQQCFRSLKTEEQSLIITFSYSSICFCLPANTVAVSFYMITERFEAFELIFWLGSRILLTTKWHPFVQELVCLTTDNVQLINSKFYTLNCLSHP